MLPVRIFKTLLWCFPAQFRHEYGAEMVRAFRQDLRDARRRSGRRAEAAIWLQSISDIFTTAPQEHYHVIQQDIRYAFRTLPRPTRILRGRSVASSARDRRERCDL
jgi:hypothetical protein